MTKLDQFHYHEFVDRIHCIQSMLDNLIYTHPVLKQHPEMKDAYDQAEEALGSLYQVAADVEERNT